MSVGQTRLLMVRHKLYFSYLYLPKALFYPMASPNQKTKVSARQVPFIIAITSIKFLNHYTYSEFDLHLFADFEPSFGTAITNPKLCHV